MTFGDRLNRALKSAKKDRRALAEELGVTRQAIGMVITGGGLDERRLSADNTRKAAAFLKVSYEWLATGDGDMHQTEAPVTSGGYIPSPMALELAWLFDQLTDRMDRHKAWREVTDAIDRIHAERTAPQSHTLIAPAKAGKQRA